MDDFQVILDELDKMESESKARERERARIAAGAKPPVVPTPSNGV